jgi:predicted nucleotidyltransferase
MLEFGLDEKYIQEIKSILKNYREIKLAKIYGSRALGTSKANSDIDLVIYGENIDRKICLSLKDKLEEESSIPYFFDITHYESISNNDLKEHIDAWAWGI